MPHYQHDWELYVKDVWVEYQSARVAVNHLRSQLRVDANFLNDDPTRNHIGRVGDNLEGTYLVRVFAAFEAALRSYERCWHPDRTKSQRPDAAQMIDEIGARQADDVPRRHKRVIGLQVRERAHQVRRTRNYWAHDDADATEVPMSLEQAKGCLLEYIRKMPLEWG